MSDTSSIPEGASQATPAATSTVLRRPRVWPAAIIAALMWGVLLVVPQLDVDQFEFLNDFVKFMVLMGAVGLGTLLFFGWWLFFSRLPWKDRLLLPVVAALVG